LNADTATGAQWRAPTLLVVAISREELVERIAEISHATWLLQAVRDNSRSLETPTYEPPDYRETDDWRADCARAEEIVRAVRDEGASLSDLSRNKAHQVMPHDYERAENTVLELERLGVWPIAGD
jgi:hypothetical protein